MLDFAVLIQFTHVTDGRTDGIAVAYTAYAIACMLSRIKTEDNVDATQCIGFSGLLSVKVGVLTFA